MLFLTAMISYFAEGHNATMGITASACFFTEMLSSQPQSGPSSSSSSSSSHPKIDTSP
jgi:hypothetical protein